CKADGAEHAQLVFCKALMSLTDGADNPVLQIFAAVHVVEDFTSIGIKQQAVDGKVAALHVKACVLGELNFIGMPAVRISTVAAKSCNFNGVVVAFAFWIIAADRNQHHAELRAPGESLRKDADHFMRRSGGGNVIVGGFAIEQQVAHTAADEIGGVSVFAQRACDADGFLRFVSRQIHFVFTAKDAKVAKELISLRSLRSPPS